MVIRTSQSNVSLEKNEVISISPNKINYQTENLFVRFPQALTMIFSPKC